MREQEQQFEGVRDPEATVIRPLFDEDATEVARPVIPLDDRAVAEGVGAYVGTGTAPPVYTRAWKRRTQSTVMLVIAALFAGTVAGIAGLYLYQRSRTSDSAASGRTSAPEQATPATSEAPQTTTTAPQPTTTTTTAPSTAEVAPPAVAADEVAAGAVEAEKSTIKVSDGEGAAREAERTNARRAPVDDDVEEAAAAAPVKRGRKGDEDDAEPSEPGRNRRPPVYDTQGPAPEGSAAARRAAREEDRLRRMRRERRRERGEAYMVDSIRGIFEGGRQSPPR